MQTFTEPTPTAKLEPAKLAASLRAAVEEGLATHLVPFDDVTASQRPAEGKWSAKEVIGHLIDSANNNLQRIVRLSIEESIDLPGYKQNEWVAVQHYNKRHWSDLVIVWSALNLHLAHTIAFVEKQHLARIWHYGKNELTLGFIIEDYIAHMRHHLQAMSKEVSSS